jgi:DUF1707 SHOCT-like domain
MMAGPGDQTAAAVGNEGLRASHAEREQVIGALKAAFIQGMLAKDEFDERVGQAFAARTYGDLAALTADLPALPITAQPPAPARAAGEQPVLRPGKAIAVATTLYAGVWSFTFLPSWPTNSEGEPAAAIVALFVSTTIIYVLVLVMAVGYAIAGRRQKRTGGQSPRPSAHGTGGPPSWRLPPVGPDGEFPPADRGHRHIAEAARRRRPRPSLPVRSHCPDGALAAGTVPVSG